MGSNTDMWHSFSPEKIEILLKTQVSSGLSQNEAEKRILKNGKNEFSKVEGFALPMAVIRQIRSPLSVVLIFAGVATLFLRDYIDALVIFGAVIFNVSIGVLQEGKAAKVFESLEKSQKKSAVVLRDSTRKVISSSDVVVGDIVLLRGGDSVPADIRLIKAKDMAINEASLTGEWMPVQKTSKTLSSILPITEQINMVWMGTLVSEGDGIGVVINVGDNARFGKISKAVQENIHTITPLQKNIRSIATFLIWIVVIAIVSILILGLLRGEPLEGMLLLAIAVAVAAIPEGLPAAVTVVLALGMETILRKGGLVKNLLAAETLGSTTVVITDKTGTLTNGVMLINGIYSAQGIKNGDISPEKDNREVLKMAVLSSDAFIEEVTRIDENGNATEEIIVEGRPIEKAIVERGLTAGLAQGELFKEGHKRLDFTQFEATRRYAISLNTRKQSGMRIYISGSPEHLLEKSSRYLYNGEEIVLDDKARARFQKIQNDISAQGMRLTAIAYKGTTDTCIPETIKEGNGERDFIFAGLIAFSDSVRDEVPRAITEVHNAGARVIMATGDYPQTARAVAREVGIDTRINIPVLTGAEMAEMNDAQLLKALNTYNVIARVVPDQKLRVAHILKNNGDIVAMTGDGVNDAPALRAADIGIAVGSGTEVAKAAADLVLIRNSFSVITTAIAEGRHIITNIRKIVSYLLSTSFTEIIIIGGALAIGSPIPLLPTQILWANTIGEGFMSFPFAFEPQEKGIMKKRPERLGTKNILTGEIKKLILVVSMITGVLLFTLYFILLSVGLPIKEVRTVVFAGHAIASMFFAFSFKDLTRPLWHIPLLSNKFLIGAVFVSFGLLVLALTYQPLQNLLSLTSLSIKEVLLLVILGIINLATIEGAKAVIFKHKS